MTPWAAGLSVHGLPGKRTKAGCHFLLQGTFLTPGVKPESPALQADSLPLATTEASKSQVCRDRGRRVTCTELIPRVPMIVAGTGPTRHQQSSGRLPSSSALCLLHSPPPKGGSGSRLGRAAVGAGGGNVVLEEKIHRNPPSPLCPPVFQGLQIPQERPAELRPGPGPRCSLGTAWDCG